MGSEFQEPPKRPHIIVVGAGVVGASIAWHLATHPTRPADVTIVAEDVGGTATPCSFAWLNASWHNPRFYYDFRRRSIARWRDLEAEVSGLGELVNWCGSISWDMPPDKLAQYQREHAAWGYDIQRISRAEIKALEPNLAFDSTNDDSGEPFVPEWAVRVSASDEGAVEAAEAARLLVADAQRRGAARLLAGTAVAGFLRGDGAEKDATTTTTTSPIAGVVTSSGAELRADHVVLAAGVGCAALCAAAGVRLPMRSPPGLLVRSRPFFLPGGRRVLNHLVYTTRGHMRQTADGRVLGGSDFAGGDPGADPEAEAARQFALIRDSFRREVVEGGAEGGTSSLEMEGFTVGYRPTPEDGIPILGATGRRGLSVAVMHSGVTNAALVGKLIAESVLTGQEDPALADFSLGRFEKKEAA